MASTPVILYYDVDISGTCVSALVPVPTPSLPTSHITMAFDKTTVYASGVLYNVVRDASGFISDGAITASGNTLPDLTYISQRASSDTAAWTYSGSGLVNLSVSFDDQAPLTIPYSTITASSIVGTSTVGRHILYIASRIMNLDSTVALESSIENLLVTEQQVSQLMAGTVADILGTQQILTSILNTTLAADGPIFDTELGTHVFYFQPGMRDVILILNFTSIDIDVQYNGVEHTIGISNLPVLIRLTDL